MSWLVKTRAFGVGGNLQHLLDDNDPEAKVNTTLGGRVDVARLFDDIKVVGSITVSSALPLSLLNVVIARPRFYLTCKSCHSMVAAIMLCFCSGREHQGNQRCPLDQGRAGHCGEACEW